MSVMSTPAVVAQIQALEGTFESLGQSLAGAVATGNFGAVLDSVQAEMAGIGASSTSLSPTPAPATSAASGGYGLGSSTSTAFLATANLLGANDASSGLDALGGSGTLGGSGGLDGLGGSGTGLVGLEGSSLGTALSALGGVSGQGAARSMAPGSGAPGAGIPASLGVPAQLVSLFERAAQRSGVPAALLAAVAKQESGFDPSAVSSAGAEGLMQLMPSTAAGLGVDAFDPQQAVDGAATLLASYLQQYGGSVPLALAAYNAGPGAVARYGGIPPYTQTQNYVRDIMASLGVGA